MNIDPEDEFEGLVDDEVLQDLNRCRYLFTKQGSQYIVSPPGGFFKIKLSSLVPRDLAVRLEDLRNEGLRKRYHLMK